MTAPIVSGETMSRAIFDANHYHDWLFNSFADRLRPGSALEIGSGHGMYTRRLAGRQKNVIVSDIDPLAVERIETELADLHNIRYLVMDGIEREKVGDTALDNIVLINVLEHIEDDRGLLEKAWASLAPGGKLIVFVPAFPLLYSRMDADAGHFRRYRQRQLNDLLVTTGFRIEDLRYFNSVGFFGWWANKLAGSGINAGSTNLQVSLYNRAIPILRHADRLLPFVGQSILATGVKH